MIRCLTPDFDMLRSPLPDRPRPFATIIQNDDRRCVLSVQSTEHPRPTWQKTTAVGALNTVNTAPAAMTASPASALSP